MNLQTAYANQYATEEVVNAYYEMHAKVKEELGINLMVLYSYRSYEDQEKLYNEYKKVSVEYADTLCSRPGHSEHQTGLTLDLVSTKNQTLTKFIESEEYKWLLNNAHKYGFIIRYPQDKYKITGYKSETNHLRYVGIEFATTLYNEQITLDEYIAYYN
jgi:D-alanyl-D-alanine carboxypeptidase